MLPATVVDMAPSALLDANVLFPNSLRDLLIRLAAAGVIRVHWTERILDEMVSGVLKRYPDIKPERMVRTRALMAEAVRDSIVDGYEHLIDTLELPDHDDRHVVAAAIHSRSPIIVTENIRDFPAAVLGPLGIEAQTADTFVLDLVERYPDDVLEVVRQQAADLTNPPMNPAEVVGRLEIAGLVRTASELRRLGI